MSNSKDEMSRFLTAIAEDLEIKCRASMLHDSMDLSRLMFHVQSWRKVQRGKTLGQGTRQGKMRRIFQGRVVLKSVTSIGLRRDSSTKNSKVHPRVSMIGILSRKLREAMK